MYANNIKENKKGGKSMQMKTKNKTDNIRWPEL